jgi:DNA-binding protein Alba
MLELKIGHKPIKQYISACLVYWSNNEDKSVKVCARGKLTSKAVDVAEIIKRFKEHKLKVYSIVVDSVELVNRNVNGVGVRDIPITKFVSTIEILLKEVNNK